MSAYKDGMMGLMVGDALGGAVQFMSREEVSKNPVVGMRPVEPFGLPVGSWSDDSSMALATLDSLRRKGKIDLVDIMNNFVMWKRDGEFTPTGFAFDIGGTCASAIDDYINRGDIKTCGRKRGHNNGNGSLMRILPVCIFCYEKINAKEMTIEEAVESIENVSALTHAHNISKRGCGIYFFLVKAILDHKDKLGIRECLDAGVSEALSFYNKIEAYNNLYSFEKLIEREDSEVKTTGYVVDTLEASIWGLCNGGSYKESLLKLVNFGDDSDTVGAVAGGLAGLYYGYGGIPEEWIRKIREIK